MSTTNETGWSKKKWRVLANRKRIVFHNGYAQPYTSLVTLGKLVELDRKNMLHSGIVLTLATSDYHLFRSLLSSLNGENFTIDDDLKFLSVKEQNFTRNGIMQMKERLQNILEQNGKCIKD